MNVNIVFGDYQKDGVLGRFAKTLATLNGWTLGRRPNEHADLNYYQVYVEWAQGYTDWNHTPSAAYFSHREPETPFKALFWDTANAGINYPVCTARMYGDLLSRPYIYAHAPIPHDVTIMERPANPRPVIGFAGTVYPSGRKGEKLAAGLCAEYESRADFLGIGAGWPCKCVPAPLTDLPRLYNSLDLYVCTSLTEGVPMPPLFALACGVPVVIPRGVGMLDELPDVPGIWRYERGDAVGLSEAVSRALDSRADREALAATVKDYTPEQWARDHARGFEEAMAGKLAKPEPAQVESDRHGKRGAYYVAYGDPARNCAEGAIRSFKQYMPNIPVALVSDSPLGPEDVFISHSDDDIGGRSAKTLIDSLAPRDWQTILYLDADTEVIADISLYYQLVEDGYDLAICKNPGKYHLATEMRRSDNGAECDYTFSKLGTDELIQLNGGVFCYGRSSRTKAFFAAWHSEWLRYGARDQGALLRALWMHPLKMIVLGNEWNTITRYDSPDRSAGILHYPMTARRWRGVLHGRLDDKASWDAVKQFEAK